MLVLLALIALFVTPLALADEGHVTIEVHGVEAISLADGTKLRLAGLEGPLPEHEGLQAAGQRALATLLEGDAVAMDEAQAWTDRLCRINAQAFRQSDGLWLQAWLLRQGHARFDPFSAPEERALELRAIEATARQQRAGLWSHPAYQVKTSDPEALLPWIGSRQVFEGEVFAAGRGRGDLYLNFGEDRGSDTTARIGRSDLRRFEEAGFTAESLQGAHVELRGRLQSWNGPFLELHSPLQIQLLQPASGD
ncbi:MAG: thermonuclease family protein [Pseudomonadota bacterium]